MNIRQEIVTVIDHFAELKGGGTESAQTLLDSIASCIAHAKNNDLIGISNLFMFLKYNISTCKTLDDKQVHSAADCFYYVYELVENPASETYPDLLSESLSGGFWTRNPTTRELNALLHAVVTDSTHLHSYLRDDLDSLLSEDLAEVNDETSNELDQEGEAVIIDDVHSGSINTVSDINADAEGDLEELLIDDESPETTKASEEALFANETDFATDIVAVEESAIHHLSPDEETVVVSDEEVEGLFLLDDEDSVIEDIDQVINEIEIDEVEMFESISADDESEEPVFVEADDESLFFGDSQEDTKTDNNIEALLIDDESIDSEVLNYENNNEVLLIDDTNTEDDDLFVDEPEDNLVLTEDTDLDDVVLTDEVDVTTHDLANALLTDAAQDLEKDAEHELVNEVEDNEFADAFVEDELFVDKEFVEESLIDESLTEETTDQIDEHYEDEESSFTKDSDLDNVKIEPLNLFAELCDAAEMFKEEHSINLEVQDLSAEQQEVMAIFAEELNELSEPLQAELTLAESVSILHSHGNTIENLLDAADVIGYDGLTDELISIYQSIAVTTAEPSQESVKSLVVWPFVLKKYVSEGNTADTISLLHLFSNSIRDASEQVSVAELLENLDNFVLPEIESSATERATVANEEDLSLELSGEVDDALLQSFLTELPDQTVEFTRAIEAFIEGQSFNDLDIARRIAHTIKGSGNTVGIRGLANMTHQLEDILDVLAKRQITPEAELADLLMQSADTVEGMTEAFLESRPLPNEAIGVYQSILDWANVLDGNEIIPSSITARSSEKDDSISESVSESLSMADVHSVYGQEELVAQTKTLIEEAPQKIEPLAVNQSIHHKPAAGTAPAAKAMAASVRVSDDLIDDLIRIAGENMISSGRIFEHTRTTKDSLQTLRKHHGQLNLLMSELEQLVFIRGVSSDRNNVNAEFDPLEIEEYNELHTATQRLVESVVDSLAMIDSSISEVLNLEAVVLDQMQLQRQNQDSVIQMRMLPVSHMSSRFGRAVRQACRLTGKKVDFDMQGEHTLVDSNVLQQLVDPIMHILRNAIDHGIESEEVRRENGKSEIGSVILKFERVGDQIVVQCSDDGAGLNHEKILAKAIQNGLIKESNTELSMDEVTRFLLMPGFSTKDDVTQVSGRGIGMDVVNQMIKEIKGSLSISTSQGEGTVISVFLPVSLMSTHALLVDIDDKRIAVSNHGVDDVVYLDANSIKDLNGKKVMTWRNELINTHSLSSVLQLPSFVQDKIAIIVRSTEGSYSAVTVPFVVDSRDLVLKPLSRYLPRVNGVVGASILGDGRVTPVIDLTELNTNQVLDQLIINQASGYTEQSLKQKHPCVLVVDDSLSARNSMSQFVTDLGYQVLTAKDGIEAQQVLDDNLIISVITDLEMPRMNGIDLARHMKNRNEFKSIPVMMVTSRSTDKHKDLAKDAGVDHYFTKPFDEDRMAQILNESIGVTA